MCVVPGHHKAGGIEVGHNVWGCFGDHLYTLWVRDGRLAVAQFDLKDNKSRFSGINSAALRQYNSFRDHQGSMVIIVTLYSYLYKDRQRHTILHAHMVCFQDIQTHTQARSSLNNSPRSPGKNIPFLVLQE